MTLHDHPVDGHLLARPNANQITDLDCLDRDVLLHAVTDHTGRLGLQAHQSADRLAGSLLGPRFQPSAHEDQGDDDDRRLVVEVVFEPPLPSSVGPKGDEGAVAVGHAGADGHKRVHVRAAVLGGCPCGAVKDLTSPELDDGRGDEQERRQVHHRDRHRRVHQHHHHGADTKTHQRLALEVIDLALTFDIALVDGLGRLGVNLGRGRDGL